MIYSANGAIFYINPGCEPIREYTPVTHSTVLRMAVPNTSPHSVIYGNTSERIQVKNHTSKYITIWWTVVDNCKSRVKRKTVVTIYETRRQLGQFYVQIFVEAPETGGRLDRLQV